MDQLNYHHLRYFRDVAHEGNLTRAAERLNVSQSALSTQIRALEARLGHALFERVGRRLELTEVGRITLDHADRIFAAGADLMAVLQQSGARMPPLRVGAASTLSRNYQRRFLGPVLGRDDVELILRSGSEAELVDGLSNLSLDVALMTEPPRGDGRAEVRAQRLAEQAVGLHGRAEMMRGSLAEVLAEGRFLLPTDPTISAGFVALGERMGVSPRIAASVDDMAMVRLLARDGAGIAVAPSVVVADELIKVDHA
jgi:LysR family transcriptional activator of nhaA